MKIYRDLFEKIISPENLFLAWDEFRKGKRRRRDIQVFEYRLEENIFRLHKELRNKTYKHKPYQAFFIQDPKQRHIHKAAVVDRVLHHAIFAVLRPIFEPIFIDNSFSCRIGKGIHNVISKSFLIRLTTTYL